MRKVLLLAIGFGSVVGVLAAQEHTNLTEKRAKDVIVFSSDTKVGTTMLKAGEYRVVCDTRKVTFNLLVEANDRERMSVLDPNTQQLVIGANKAALEVECKGRELGTARKDTQVETVVGADGVRYLDKLYLRGSTVEHVFK
jgi:hypothetical protein